ncbi:hypothetical protein FZC83_01805 [Rossellomorea marisflavi]|uniref:Uncharacterized protein n=1 Tax=Rossellomorea marisflavi TaxID=189381 RepID=A0A5D4RZD1_9BACI|nr:hypothetical protein [Rossellomorea marisflavi]TYS56330.1 hypothetical protein FZC83_01805 [Rossellomorea marisflavi]
MVFGKRKEFKNVTSELVFNPVKKFSAYLVVDGEIKPIVVEGKFRSQVIADVKAIAKAAEAKFDGKIYPVTN